MKRTSNNKQPLLKKESSFQWTTQCEEAFKKKKCEMFLRGELRTPSVKHQPHLIKEFHPGDRIQACDYTVGSTERWRFGTIQERLGRLHYKIITDDGSVWHRHID
ncbi:unnamed protein product [Pieris brassicae]|uniref:Uncharacterized protein n=1 Tax=Pieris brassicae TaxID=7116 RepID=A0A9P0TVL5_PIEBR|nr:unnamed protein product [Pieris brassicae]